MGVPDVRICDPGETGLKQDVQDAVEKALGRVLPDVEAEVEKALEKKLPAFSRDVALMVIVEFHRMKRDDIEQIGKHCYEQLRLRGVRLWLDQDGTPRAGPPEAITPAVQAVLTVYRTELIKELEREAADKSKTA